MTDRAPIPLVKNPRRVPTFSQVADPVGASGGRVGPGVQIQSAEEIAVMADNQIAEDGIYETEAGDRFQFSRGHVVADPSLYRKVGELGEAYQPEQHPPAAEIVTPGATVVEPVASTAAGNAPAEELDGGEGQADVKAESAPENKAAPAPSKKS